jgi:fibro-slime domain-containing protein
MAKLAPPRSYNIDASLLAALVLLGVIRETQAAGEAPETIELTGIVRDFKERSDPAGHPDFEQKPDKGFGLYCGNVDLFLGDDGKPVFTGSGNKITSQWTDAEGRPIARHMHNRRFDETGALVDDPGLDDAAGESSYSSQGGIQSGESFSQWYNDVLGVNLSKTLSLTFVRQADGSYVFDDKDDDLYASRGGFFPIEDELFGNPGGHPDRNYHFTFELHTKFTYMKDGDQIFKFVGDDDVWVYIDGKLAIDLGGVHAATEQFVDLNRLGLEDGKSYRLDFFFAERHRTESNFRIETNLHLASSGPKTPSVTTPFD